MRFHARRVQFFTVIDFCLKPNYALRQLDKRTEYMVSALVNILGRVILIILCGYGAMYFLTH